MPTDHADPLEAPSGHRWSSTLLAVLVAAAVLALVALTLTPLLTQPAAGGGQSLAASAPADSSVESGFARDMRAHLLQGVELSVMVDDRSNEARVRSLARQIALIQQEQAGQLRGWLVLWGASPTAPAGALAWMRADLHTHQHLTATGASVTTPVGAAGLPAMPGMASTAEVRALQRSTGRTADVRYLRLMVKHQSGSLELARAVLRRSTDPAVLALARTIVDTQSVQLRRVLELLMLLAD